jgi:hypothetical protein
MIFGLVALDHASVDPCVLLGPFLQTVAAERPRHPPEAVKQERVGCRLLVYPLAYIDLMLGAVVSTGICLLLRSVLPCPPARKRVRRAALLAIAVALA